MNANFELSNTLLEALRELVVFVSTNNIDYCLIGGLAVQVHGEPRFTRDIDLCVLTEIESRTRLIDQFLLAFQPLLENPKDLALTSQILPLSINGIIVDISLGLTGFEKKAIARAEEYELFQGFKLKVASAEDLIVYKCLAARPKDIQDIDSILARNRSNINLQYIRATLADFESALSSSILLTLLEERLKLQ